MPQVQAWEWDCMSPLSSRRDRGPERRGCPPAPPRTRMYSLGQVEPISLMEGISVSSVAVTKWLKLDDLK